MEDARVDRYPEPVAGRRDVPAPAASHELGEGGETEVPHADEGTPAQLRAIQQLEGNRQDVPPLPQFLFAGGVRPERSADSHFRARVGEPVHRGFERTES